MAHSPNPSPLRQAIDWAIPQDEAFREDADTFRKARFIAAFACILAFWGAFFVPIYYFVVGSAFAAISLAVASFLSILTFPVLRKSRSIVIAGNYLTATMMVILAILSFVAGADTYAALTWVSIAPLMAACLVGRRSAYFWTASACAAVIGLVTLKRFGYLGTLGMAPEAELILFGCGQVALTGTIALLAFAYESVKDGVLAQVHKANNEAQHKRLLAELALRDLESTQAQLVESRKMTALSEMSGGIAHEINSPLATIQTLAGQVKDLVQDDPPDRDRLLKIATTIEDTTTRIARIVSALRTFSRDAGTDPMAPESLSEIIQGAFALCQERFRARQVDMVLGALPDVRIRCRRLQISQILLYLLNNALDAVSTLPGPRWIRVSAQLQGQSVRISVTDNGAGISASIRNKIFQPFFTTKPLGSGTGLGLSTSRGLAESHGGKLELDLNEAETTFVLTLPAVPSLSVVPGGAEDAPKKRRAA